MQRPTAEDLQAVYPPAALASDVGGRAVLRCTVTASGELVKCRAESEEPHDAGFGEAVMKLAPKFRYAPRESGFETAIPIRFKSPAEDQQGPPPRDVAFSKPAGRWARLGPIGPYYPERAERLGVDGRAVIDCQVRADRRLTSCSVVNEAPKDWGFQEAAMRAAKDGWLIAGAVAPDARPSPEGFYRFTLKFNAFALRQSR